MKSRMPTRRDIAKLLSFRSRLSAEGFTPFKRWHGGPAPDGQTIEWPWPEYEDVVNDFFDLASSDCWCDFQYRPDAAAAMLEDRNLLASADLAQVRTMLTYCARGERFCDGHWGEMITNGHIERLLRRLEEIAGGPCDGVAPELEIRDESPTDIAVIASITAAAFAHEPHSHQTEPFIIAALRAAGALALSLVAVDCSEVVGHVAFSPVTIDGRECGWYGVGPVSVRPDRQRQGIGQALMNEGLDRLRAAGAAGCVLVGEPGYYGRFGFRACPEFTLEGVPPEYFQALAFGAGTWGGVVVFHPAFGATAP